MKYPSSFFLMLLMLFGTAGNASVFDESNPYGAACVTIVRLRANEESILAGGVQPDAGDLIKMYVGGSAGGDVIAVALKKKDGQLVPGWRPEIVKLNRERQLTLPPLGREWSWTEAIEPFEIFVVFTTEDDPVASAARKLVAELREPGKKPGDLALHTAQLRLEIQKWQQKDEQLATVPADSPSAITGTTRSGDFPWRRYAIKANLGPGQPAVLVFRKLNVR